MTFKSKKDGLFSTIILGTNGFLILVLFFLFSNKTIDKNDVFPIIILLATIIFTLWLFFGTYYELSKESGLVYHCGPIHGKIKLERISEIVKGKTLWVGFRPATSRNGLIIKYDKYNEIYISPQSNDTFIKKILELNNAIKITE